MEDIGLARQGWKWICSHKHVYIGVGNGAAKLRDSIAVFTRNYGPIICRWFVSFCGLVTMLWIKWLNCVYRGFQSFRGLDSAALFVILWSCLLSLTSMLCLLYIFIGLLAAGAVILQLGFTPGIFIVGLFGILTLWMYANLWIAAILFMAGGYLFSLNHTRLVVFMAVTYALYSVKVQVGWRGVFLSLNFAFITNDLFNFLVQWCDNVAAEKPCEEKEDSTDSVTAEKFSTEGDYSIPKTHKNNSSKPPIKTTPNYHIDNGTQNSAKKTNTDTSSVSEMNRILKSTNHYESLGLSRHKFDISSLRKEYRKKAMLVHPDKNMGVSLASDSFKMLQCAYEVLSDSTKKQEYDKQLRKDDMKVIPKGYHTSCEDNSGCNSEQSRRISCTKCGNLHIWVCTSRSKTKARWCQNCGQYHQARDGDGWVEYKGSLVFERPHKTEIPRAFVCAESKIFDVSEWAICQGMACRPNTHRPTFHVNMVGLDLKMKSQRWKHQWGGSDSGNEDDDRDEFETWLKQALASGFFHETCSSSRTRRKSWSPFIRLNPKKKSSKEWRRSA